VRKTAEVQGVQNTCQ